MNKYFKLVLTLTILGVFSALFLAFIYEKTLPLINEHQLKVQEKSILAVLPAIDDYQEVIKADLTFYEGYQNGKRVGVATIVSGGGFQGPIDLMVGTEPGSGKIYGVRVLNHQETPGLGAFISSDRFLTNFADKPFANFQVVKRPSTNPKEVEAISGATISSQRVTELVEKAIAQIEKIYGSDL